MGGELIIFAQDGQPIRQRLSNQHAIEWIFVMKWQI
jgi:hypothetical protein